MKPCGVGRVVGAIVIACSMAGAAYAKLPALNDEQNVKAAEAKAKSAEAAKHQSESLVKVQDRVAERYKREKASAHKR